MARASRQQLARRRRRREDVRIGVTALLAAMLVLPLAQTSWHGPEVAAVLAVSATALLAGQRWPVAVIVVAEMMLLPTILPRLFVDPVITRFAAAGALVAIVPGLLAMRRAAAALVLVMGRRRTRATCRRLHLAMVGSTLVATLLPFV